MAEWWKKAAAARKARGVTLDQLGADLEVTGATVGHWLTGIRAPSAHSLARLARRLDISLDELMDETVTEVSLSERFAEPPVGWLSVLPAEQVRAFIDGRWRPDDATDRVMIYAPTTELAFAYRVQGQSMASPAHRLHNGTLASFPPGTIVVIDPGAPSRPGDLVLALREGQDEPTFKLWAFDDGEHYLEALDPRFPPRRFDPNTELIGPATEIVQQSLRRS